MGSSYWSHNIIRLVYNIITFSIPTWDQHLNTTSSTRSHFQRFNSANMHFASVTKIEPKKSGQKSSPTTKDIRVAYKCKHMKSLFEWTLVVRKSRFSLCLLSKYLLCSKSEETKKISIFHLQTFVDEKIRFSRRANMYLYFFPAAKQQMLSMLLNWRWSTWKKAYKNIITSRIPVYFAIFVVVTKYSRHQQLIDSNNFFNSLNLYSICKPFFMKLCFQQFSLSEKSITRIKIEEIKM